MGTQEILEQAKDLNANLDLASEQRVANNAIQKAQLNILKFIAGTVFISALGLIPVVVSDHFKLDEMSRAIATISAAQIINTARISELGNRMPSLGSRWSFGMQEDFNNQLGARNHLELPDVKGIQESHLGDLGQ